MSVLISHQSIVVTVGKQVCPQASSLTKPAGFRGVRSGLKNIF